MALSRDELLEAGRRRPCEEVDIPSLGGTVYVRMMREADNEAYAHQLFPMGNGTRAIVEQHVKGLLIAKCLEDAAGARMFTDADEDLQAIGSLRYDVVDQLFEACRRVNAFGHEAVKALEPASAPTQTGASSSVSPNVSA